MAQCKYQNKTKYLEYQCSRKALSSSSKGFCILHEDSERKDPEKTRKAFYKEIDEGKTNFSGAFFQKLTSPIKQLRE